MERGGKSFTSLFWLITKFLYRFSKVLIIFFGYFSWVIFRRLQLGEFSLFGSPRDRHFIGYTPERVKPGLAESVSFVAQYSFRVWFSSWAFSFEWNYSPCLDFCQVLTK